MNNEQYMKMLYAIDDWFQRDSIIIQWNNGLKIKCKSFTGVTETDTEPGEENYIGEYSIGVNEIEVLESGTDDSILIYDDSIEICLINIPEKICSEDGTVLWERDKQK